MIAKGKAIAHGGNAIDYALREGKLDKIVGRNMIESDAPADILREFEMVNRLKKDATQFKNRPIKEYLDY